jgi:hypothetical protein
MASLGHGGSDASVALWLRSPFMIHDSPDDLPMASLLPQDSCNVDGVWRRATHRQTPSSRCTKPDEDRRLDVTSSIAP